MKRGHKFSSKDELRSAIEEITDDETANTWDVSAITDMSYLFYMTQFNAAIDQWDTSNVTTMEKMFSVSRFNKPLPWNVSKVVTMESMFNGSIFNQPLEWNTSSVTNMKYMFKDSKYNHPLLWDVSKVETMEGMFQYSQFNQPISWVTSSVTNMKRMFSGCPFNQPLSWDVSNVTTMEGMFNASPFNQDISTWNVEKVTDMSHMFEYSTFNQDISRWNIRNIHMEDMFSDSMEERNKPSESIFPSKQIKKKITIWIKLHGRNLQTKLNRSLPLHTCFAVRPGACSFFLHHDPETILQQIEDKQVIYKDKPIHAGNELFAEQYQPYKDRFFDEHAPFIMKGSPEYEREELKTLHREQTSPFRSLVFDREYFLADDVDATTMGIFIINAQDNEREVEFTYPSIKIGSQKNSKSEFLELQKRNVLNVSVAKYLLPEGMRISDTTDFTEIPHYETIQLSDILLFFGKLGYDYVNIIDDACRSESDSPAIHRRNSNTERIRGVIFKERFHTAGTRKNKRNGKTKKFMRKTKHLFK